ncbi:MAG: aldo/keto reductase [Bacteroidia bacterium]|nr:aldo/keto reductase [Bacteroidia bacterium]
MNANYQNKQSRRLFIKMSALSTMGLAFAPYLSSAEIQKPLGPLMKRTFGCIGFNVTTLGLGGQASLQWTPENTDPVAIIVKAYKLGINYFDTSNLYGTSQMFYGKAFRQIGLVPETPNYDESKRKKIFLTSKTHLRFGKGGDDHPEVIGNSNGPKGTKSLDDVRRSLTQIFGDGNGSYPAGAYLDMVLVHALSKMGEVDALYEGYNTPDPNVQTIGTLAALRDVRDGTNRTGLNPKNEKLIRHIGFSGHNDPSVMIEMIQRDTEDLLEAVLLPCNANDKLYYNMQYNVIPVAAAKNMGIIAMKVFSDGAMYTNKSEWANGKPSHVVLDVSGEGVPANQLIRYSLTIPGVHTAIVGTGKISDNPDQCQLTYNLRSAQVKPNGMSVDERTKIEMVASKIKDGKTNFFQKTFQDLSAPRDAKVVDSGNKALITWNTAYAGNAAIDRYEIWRDGVKIADIPFKPQTAKKPYQYEDKTGVHKAKQYIVKVVDKKNKVAETEPILA